jgi:hypothetical protein
VADDVIAQQRWWVVAVALAILLCAAYPGFVGPLGTRAVSARVTTSQVIALARAGHVRRIDLDGPEGGSEPFTVVLDDGSCCTGFLGQHDDLGTLLRTAGVADAALIHRSSGQ